MSATSENKHVTPWLQAYYDGELHGRRLEKVEAHLADCPECREELAELASLSALLQSDPLPQLSVSPEQFAAQVGLRLPRKDLAKAASRRSWSDWAWNLAPVAVLVMIGFVRVVALVSDLFTLIERLGINPQAVSWLLPTPMEMQVSALPRFSMLSLGWGIPFDLTLFITLGLPLLLAGGYFLWLVLWWLHQESDEKTVQPNQVRP
ncbi:MAG: zf-HC2 domain-containing protein [Anaerolineales bacterium]